MNSQVNAENAFFQACTQKCVIQVLSLFVHNFQLYLKTLKEENFGH